MSNFLGKTQTFLLYRQLKSKAVRDGCETVEGKAMELDALVHRGVVLSVCFKEQLTSCTT